jgi:hypothetical protein
MRSIKTAIFIMSACGLSSMAQAVVLPYGYGVAVGKRVELKARLPWIWDHWQNFSQGFVDAYSNQYQRFQTGLGRVELRVINGSRCSIYLNMMVHFYPIHLGGELTCANFFKDDEHEGGNKNNGQGLTMNGIIHNYFDGTDKPINITLWPKREDRTRVTLSGPGAMGTWELEIDVDENS